LIRLGYPPPNPKDSFGVREAISSIHQQWDLGVRARIRTLDDIQTTSEGRQEPDVRLWKHEPRLGRPRNAVEK
jgi:hypothetical protein